MRQKPFPQVGSHERLISEQYQRGFTRLTQVLEPDAQEAGQACGRIGITNALLGPPSQTPFNLVGVVAAYWRFAIYTGVLTAPPYPVGGPRHGGRAKRHAL